MFEQFDTRAKNSTEFAIYLKDNNGEPTEHYVKVGSILSTTHEERLKKLTPELLKKYWFAGIVSGWSLNEEFNAENLEKLLDLQSELRRALLLEALEQQEEIETKKPLS